MRIVAVAFLVLIAIVQPAVAQTLTPPEAQATVDVARAQATSVSRLATANAPTKTPAATLTPMPSATPWPTATPEPTATATVQPSATPAPTETAAPVQTQVPMPARPRTFADDLPIVIALCLLAAGALLGIYWLTSRTRERIEPND